MTGKITALVAAALVLGSAGAASAQTSRHARFANTYDQVRFADSYFNADYWRAVGPQLFAEPRLDPYAGTIWEGVAPY